MPFIERSIDRYHFIIDRYMLYYYNMSWACGWRRRMMMMMVKQLVMGVIVWDANCIGCLYSALLLCVIGWHGGGGQAKQSLRQTACGHQPASQPTDQTHHTMAHEMWQHIIIYWRPPTLLLLLLLLLQWLYIIIFQDDDAAAACHHRNRRNIQYIRNNINQLTGRPVPSGAWKY